MSEEDVGTWPSDHGWPPAMRRFCSLCGHPFAAELVRRNGNTVWEHERPVYADLCHACREVAAWQVADTAPLVGLDGI